MNSVKTYVITFYNTPVPSHSLCGLCSNCTLFNGSPSSSDYYAYGIK